MNGRRLWFGRAVLTATAVEVSGWMGFQRFGLRIALDDVTAVTRRPDARRSNLSFLMEGRPTLSVLVSAPGLWRLEVMQRIRAVHPERPGDADESVLSGSPVPRQNPPADETGPPAGDPPQADGSALPGPLPIDDIPLPIDAPMVSIPEGIAFRAEDDYVMPADRAAELGFADLAPGEEGSVDGLPDATPVASPDDAQDALVDVQVRAADSQPTDPEAAAEREDAGVSDEVPDGATADQVPGPLTGWKRLRDLEGESESGA